MMKTFMQYCFPYTVLLTSLCTDADLLLGQQQCCPMPSIYPLGLVAHSPAGANIPQKLPSIFHQQEQQGFQVSSWYHLTVIIVLRDKFHNKT